MKTKKIIENKQLNDIYKNSVFKGNNQVATGAKIVNCSIENCVIENGVVIENAKIENAYIQNNDINKKKQGATKLLNQEYMQQLINFDQNVFDDFSVVLCCQDKNEGIFFQQVLEKLHIKVEYLFLDTNEVKFENIGKVVARYVKKLSYNLGFCIGKGFEKINAVNSQGEILNSDEILYLLTWWFHSQNKMDIHQVCGTIFTSLGIENKLASLNIYLQRGENTEKALKRNMRLSLSCFGSLASGKFFLLKENKKIEANAFYVARMLLTIYYENKNIWQKVKENKFMQLTKQIVVKSENKNAIKHDLKTILDFYRLKIKGKGRVELWLKDNIINVLVECKEKATLIILFNDINKKILRLLLLSM